MAHPTREDPLGQRDEVSERPAYQQRAIQERDELDERIARLHAYLEGGASGASLTHASLLRAQVHAMVAYSNILSARIALFQA